MLQLNQLWKSGQLNSRGVGRVLKMTQCPKVLPQPPLMKTLTVFTTMMENGKRLIVNQIDRIAFWTTTLVCLKFPLGGCYTAFDAWSKAHQAVHVAGGSFWSRSRQFSWTYPPCQARDQTAIHAVEIPLFSPSKEGRVCHRQWRWWPPSLGMRKALCSLTTSRRAKLSLGNTMPTCWGCMLRKAIESKRPGKLTKGDLFHQENAPAHKSVVDQADVRNCGFCDHLTFSVPQHEKRAFGWEAVSDRWWGHIPSWGLFRGWGWELLYHGNPSAATPMEDLCGPQGRLWYKK